MAVPDPKTQRNHFFLVEEEGAFKFSETTKFDICISACRLAFSFITCIIIGNSAHSIVGGFGALSEHPHGRSMLRDNLSVSLQIQFAV